MNGKGKIKIFLKYSLIFDEIQKIVYKIDLNRKKNFFKSKYSE